MAEQAVDVGADGEGKPREVVEVELPNGTVALVRAAMADGSVEGSTKVRALDRFDFDGVAGTLGGVAEALQGAVAAIRPRTVRVELGIGLAVKSGKLMGLIVEGTGNADLRVTLEWGDDPAVGG
jgi:hypothetical protein